MGSYTHSTTEDIYSMFFLLLFCKFIPNELKYVHSNEKRLCISEEKNIQFFVLYLPETFSCHCILK